MMSEISSLLQHGWKNIWKDKILWVFSSLVLIDPVIRLVVPIQRNVDLTSSLFNLLESLAAIYFMFMSYAGVSFIAYCISIGKPVDIQTAFQAATKLFWRVIALTFLLFLFIAPCLFVVFIFSFKQPPQIADFAHNFFFMSIPLSIFAAMWYFIITETIANNSKIGKSLKTAWTVFTDNFVSLAIIGLVLAFASYTTNVSISTVTMLSQNSFDITAFSKLDFISPHLSLTDNNFYKLATTTAQAIWRTYSTTLFTFAYLKYSGVKVSKKIMS